MKQFIATFFLLIGLCNMSMAQDSTTIFIHYETMPEYPGGDEQWKQDSEAYMETRLKNMFPQANPDSLATDERKRRIVVQCIIDKEGKVQEPVILPGHGLHPALDEVAISCVHQMRRFKPGTVKGEPRNMKYVMPFFVHPYYLRLLEREEQQSTDTTIYEVVEKMPEYPGGIDKLMEYIRKSTDNYWKKIYPKGKPVYPCESIIGRIIVSFVVNENGQVTDPVIKRSLDPILDKEAIRIVKSMPRWIPGESKGKKVKVRYTLPFQF